MSKSSSPRSVWSLVLKIGITVATAIGGVFGIQSCMECCGQCYINYHSLQCHAGRKVPFGGGLPTGSYLAPWFP